MKSILAITTILGNCLVSSKSYFSKELNFEFSDFNSHDDSVKNS